MTVRAGDSEALPTGLTAAEVCVGVLDRGVVLLPVLLRGMGLTEVARRTSHWGLAH